jgi:hypothetical protein
MLARKIIKKELQLKDDIIKSLELERLISSKTMKDLLFQLK